MHERAREALDKVVHRLEGIQAGLPDGDESHAELEEARQAVLRARNR